MTSDPTFPTSPPTDQPPPAHPYPTLIDDPTTAQITVQQLIDIRMFAWRGAVQLTEQYFTNMDDRLRTAHEIAEFVQHGTVPDEEPRPEPGTTTTWPELQSRRWVPDTPRNAQAGERGAQHLIEWVNACGGEAKLCATHRGTDNRSVIGIRTPDGWAYAKPGDWIVKSIAGRGKYVFHVKKHSDKPEPEQHESSDQS